MFHHLTLASYLFNSKAWFVYGIGRDLTYNLMLTTIPAAIRKVRERCRVVVETPWPELFVSNPDVEFVTRRHLLTTDRFITPNLRLDPRTTSHIALQALEGITLRTSPFWDMNASNHRDNLGKWRKQRQREEELLETLRETHAHPVMYITQRESARATEEFPGPYLCIDPSSNEPWESDRLIWPTERFQAVRDAFSDHRFVQVGSDKTPLLKNTVDARGLAPRKTAAILGNARFLIGTPGVTMHLNKAVGKRAAIIVGGAVREDTIDYSDDLAFFNPRECSPCINWNGKQGDCPKGRECLKGIDPGLVIKNLREHFQELSD